MDCPKCGSEMVWKPWQGSRGGWECPKDGFEMDAREIDLQDMELRNYEKKTHESY